MKRRSLFIAACVFAAASVGLNVWLLALRKDKPAEPGPAVSALPPDVSAGPVLQPVAMDFSGTAFADGSWKLTDETDPVVGIDGKPFSWEDLPQQGPIKGRLWPEPPPLPRDGGRTDFNVNRGIRKSTGMPSPIDLSPQMLRGCGNLEVPPYLDLPMDDPNDVRSKALIAYPPPR